jgi:hypothetical protein
LNALIGGGLLVAKPEGSLLEMHAEWVNKIPFASYNLPGILLFVFIGLLPFLTLIGLLLKSNWQWPNLFNIYVAKYWAKTYSLYCGIILIIWIIVQLVITAYFWLQPVLLSIGLLIIIFTMMPRIQKYYSI